MPTLPAAESSQPWPPDWVATAQYPENVNDGLLICGINWGTAEPATPATVPGALSFFSDTAVNNFPYRNRLLLWFRLWGIALRTAEPPPNSLERSIAQTNWLGGDDIESANMQGKDVPALGRAYQQHFAEKLAMFRPSLILLMSTQLMKLIDAENYPDVVATLSMQLGPLVEPRRWIQGVGRGRGQCHRMGYARFKRAPLIALPHPSWAPGADRDMPVFGETIRPLIVEYCERRSLSYCPVSNNAV